MSKKRFILEESKERDGWCVLTDTENLIVVRFEIHRFNETQQVSVLNEEDFMSLPGSPAVRIATVLREMGEWMHRHYYSVAMPTPTYEWRETEEEDSTLLLRNKRPRFMLRMIDDATPQQTADALRKAAEFVLKGGRKLRIEN